MTIRQAQLPKGWEKYRIEKICEVFDDGDWIESKDQANTGVRLIQTGNVGNGFFKVRGEKARYISEETFLRLRCTEIIEGDCLISRLPDPVGRACIIPNTGEKMITAVDCTIIRFKPNSILTDWFVYYSLSNEYQNQINSQVSGATRQRISRKNLGQITIPLPPLSEQQRIVSILDQTFAAIDKAKANAERNLKNARELFESYLQGVFGSTGSPTKREGWEEIRLGNIAHIIGGYSFKSSDFVDKGKYQVIRMGNIRPGIIRPNENPVFIDDIEEVILKRARLNVGDVVITQTGTKNKRDYGFTAIIESDGYLINQRISAIRFKLNYLPKFFLYFSWTIFFRDPFFSKETGTVGQGNVGISAITDALVPFPSMKDQQTIVTKLDAIQAEMKRLEAIYQQKILDLEELKKSVLERAFAGKLN